MRRPSSIPLTMEEKLSSNKTMSAASFDTSLPEIPIAIPMSAFLSAGESCNGKKEKLRKYSYF